MKNIYLISCSGSKLQLNKGQKVLARKLYSKSFIFQAAINYAEYQKPDKIFILSAKCGLISPDDMIEYYDINLNNFDKVQKEKWVDAVLQQLLKISDIKTDHYFFIASPTYYDDLSKNFKKENYTIVAREHTTPGKRIRWLKTQIGDYSNCSMVDHPVQVTYDTYDEIYNKLRLLGEQNIFNSVQYIQEAIRRGINPKTACRKFYTWKKLKVVQNIEN
jgi:hypothetical protein